jgi:hypothetical protein
VRIVPPGASMQYRFHVHRILPGWRLVIGDGGFPAATSEDQWTFTRAREAADTNPDVRDAVARGLLPVQDRRPVLGPRRRSGTGRSPHPLMTRPVGN